MAETMPADGCHFRSGGYAIAYTVGVCPHCGAATPMLALCLPPGHEALEVDQSGAAAASWNPIAYPAFLFYVECLEPRVVRCLQTLSAAYRQGSSALPGDTYWANHCGSCAALIEDHELYCEPEGAFMPLGAAGAAAIQVLAVDEPLRAVAGGHAEMPPWWDGGWT